jgi:hypothetical protein
MARGTRRSSVERVLVEGDPDFDEAVSDVDPLNAFGGLADRLARRRN